MYNLILIASNLFIGQYATLDNCNNAIRGIYERQMAPYPELISKKDMVEIQKSIDIQVKFQRKYICVKV